MDDEKQFSDRGKATSSETCWTILEMVPFCTVKNDNTAYVDDKRKQKMTQWN